MDYYQTAITFPIDRFTCLNCAIKIAATASYNAVPLKKKMNKQRNNGNERHVFHRSPALNNIRDMVADHIAQSVIISLNIHICHRYCSPFMLIVAPNGSINRDMRTSIFAFSSTHLIDTGSVANDDEVPNAVRIAGIK